MTHLCHAEDCIAKVPPRMLMCRKHWFRLRKTTQALVWRFYRPGQESDKQPSAAYLIVQAIAVAEVAAAEKVWTVKQCSDHVERRARSVWEHLTPDDNVRLREAIDSWSP